MNLATSSISSEKENSDVKRPQLKHFQIIDYPQMLKPAKLLSSVTSLSPHANDTCVMSVILLQVGHF